MTQKGKVATKKTEIDTFKDKLKNEYKEVYEVILDGDDYFKELQSYFRKPSLVELGMFMTEISKDEDGAYDAQIKLLKSIFIGGDDDFFEDGIMVIDVLEQLSELVTGFDIETDKVFINNRVCYKIKILDSDVEPTITIRRPNTGEMSKYQAQVKVNILTATKSLYKSCHIDGDKGLLDNDKYFLSLVSAISEIIERRTGHLSKL